MNVDDLEAPDTLMQDSTLNNDIDDDQVRQKHCTICRRPTTCYVDTYIDVFVNRATVDELRRSGFSFHCGLGQSMKYLARFDWKKHPARKDSLVEIHLDCYLEDSDICKAIVDTLMDISNHPKIESVIYQLHTSRKIRLFGIKVNPLCFVLEQPNFVQKKGLWGIIEHDTVESVDHIIRIISSLLPEEIVMTRDSWTVRQHHMDDLSKWKFNSPWKFIIRLQEEEESATGRVVKTAVREALEEFTSSLLQQDRMDNPWGSVLENLKSLFVSRSVQKDTAGQTSEASITSLAKPNTEPSSKSPTSRTKRLSFKSPVTVVESTLKRARTSEKLGYQSGQTSTWQAKNFFWRQFLQEAFPDYHNKCYFIPPIYMNRVPLSRQLVAGVPVLVPQAARGQAGWSPLVITASDLEQPQVVLDSDVRDDRAQQHVFFCLRKMVEDMEEKGMMVLSQLQFGDYLNEPIYAAAAAQLPSPSSLPSALPKNWKRGDFDVLIIHRKYGLLAVEVKAFGDNIKALNMSQEVVHVTLRKKLKQAISILDKSKAMLSHLVSDIAPGLKIAVSLAFPSIKKQQVLEAVMENLDLERDLCHRLEVSNLMEASERILCSDDLSDHHAPWEVTAEVSEKLQKWWRSVVAVHGPHPLMTSECYEHLLARFCGPATTVTVPSIMSARLSLRTLGDAVSAAGKAFTRMALYPEQINLLNSSPPRVFLAGPPGTGKTLVLLLKGAESLRHGNKIHVLSTWAYGRSANIMLCHLLKQTVEQLSDSKSANISLSHLELHHLDLEDEESTTKAVSYMADKADNSLLHVLVDEAGPDRRGHFQRFCQELLHHVPHLVLWAASCFHENTPDSWQLEVLTRPLRSPPVVVREVIQADEFETEVKRYSERGIPAPTDGPPVKNLYHKSGKHGVKYPQDCFECGREIADFLHSLRIEKPVLNLEGTYPAPPSLEFRDVLVLCANPTDSAVVRGLQASYINAKVFKAENMEDIATARTNVVWLADPNHVRGLERKIVVWLLDNAPDFTDYRLHAVSRCTSQLVFVLPLEQDFISKSVSSSSLDLML